MTASATAPDHAEVDQSTRELLDIVTRAQRLGFCRWRVATALGASPHQLALIQLIAGSRVTLPSGARRHRSAHLRTLRCAATLSTRSTPRGNPSTVAFDRTGGWPWH